MRAPPSDNKPLNDWDRFLRVEGGWEEAAEYDYPLHA